MGTSKEGGHSIQLQERDLAMLRGLFECRIMTFAHAAAIHFDGRKEYARKRLRKLKAAGLLAERPRRVNEPSVLFLAEAGILLLREQGILGDYPCFPLPSLVKRAEVSDRTVRHELAVMDVKAAFHTAVRGSSTLSIAEFGTWPRLYEFKARHPRAGTVDVKPDGFIRIHEKTEATSVIEHVFFLEVDRSTEVLEVITSRAACYLNHYRSGGFAVRQGFPRDDYRQHPFRVLIVCKSTERTDNIAKRLLRCTPPILTQVCLSTLAEVTINPFRSIWRIPSDYRKPPLCQKVASLLKSLLDSHS